MTDQNGTPTSTQADADFNARQWRFVDFAVRKSCTWERAEDDPTQVAIRRAGDYDRTGRFLALYQSGTSRRGLRIALIDPSAGSNGLRFISQQEAWILIAEGIL